MRKSILTLALVVLLVLTPIAAAQSLVVIDDFEDGAVLDDWTIEHGDSGNVSISTNAYEGDFAANVTAYGSATQTAISTTHGNYTSYSYWVNPQGPYESRSVEFNLGPSAGNTFAAAYIGSGPDGQRQFGYNDGGTVTYTNALLQNDTYYRLTFQDINYNNGTYTVTLSHVNGTEIVENNTVDFAIAASSAGSSEVNVISLGARNSVTFDYVTNGEYEAGAAAVETSLELEIDRWQPFNSTQEYTVLLNTTNTTSGVSTYTDVSADANVTVYNITNTTNFTSPIVTVNNTSDTLVSHQSTGVVAVNATYDGNTLGNATNLTVGNRNMSNIGIMPPEQWLASFLELDSVKGPHGIGSPTQWILFIVLIMVGATHLADNGWAGLGGGVLTAILLWILNYIDLGTVLSTVFVVTLLSLALLKARRLRSVNPSGGGQQ